MQRYPLTAAPAAARRSATLPLAMIGALLLLLLVAGEAAAQSPVFVDDTVSDGLVAHFKFDEGGGSTTRDWLNPALVATLNVSASLNSGVRPTLLVPNHSSLSLNNSQSVVSIPDNALAAPLNALQSNFTIAAWVRRSSLNGGVDAIYTNGTVSSNWHLDLIGPGGSPGTHHLALRFDVGGTVPFSTTAADSGLLAHTNWVHVGATMADAGTIKLYINGVERASYLVDGFATTGGTKFIGSQSASAARLPGQIDDLRFYNRALSSAEMLRLAQGHGCVTTGTEWLAALRELQCGLSLVQPGGEIWIAGGGYRPGYNLLSTFTVNKTNLSILGGFIGVESLPSQRPLFDGTSPGTILTGDMIFNDLPNAFTNHVENAQRVIDVTSGISVTIDALGVRGGNVPAGNDGGGMRVASGGNLTLHNVAFFKNRAGRHGGALSTASPLVGSGLRFDNNQSFSLGGGLFASATAPVDLQTSTLFSNTAISGGGAYLSATSEISGVNFLQNQAPGFLGGGLHAEAAISVTSSTFSGNRAQLAGGAISAFGFLNSTTSNYQANFAEQIGGAMRLEVGGTIIGGSMVSNQAKEGGGAIFSLGPLEVTSVNFTDNRALGNLCAPVCSEGSGGAIVALQAASIQKSNFVANKAVLNGGAVRAAGALVLEGGLMLANSAGVPQGANNSGRGFGGAVRAEVTANISGTLFVQNAAGQAGGGLWASGQVNSTNSSFTSNSAPAGGGLRLGSGGALVNNTLVQNTATITGGGGIWVQGGALTIARSTFVQNRATDPGGDGGAVLAHSTTLSLDSSTLLRNQARFGGGINLVSGGLTIDGGLIDGNTAMGGGGINAASGSVVISGTHMISNSAQFGGALLAELPVQITGAEVHRNRASFSGGALALNSGGQIDHSLMTLNQADISGGAILSDGPLTVADSSLLSNTALFNGGAVSLLAAGNFSGNLFQANRAPTDAATAGAGGAVQLIGGGGNVPLVLSGNTWRDNQAARGGGAISASGPLHVQGDSFADNDAGTGSFSLGGAIHATKLVSITHSFFVRNVAIAGGALATIHTTSDRALVNNSLFVSNTIVLVSSGADLFFNSGDVTVTNNTFSGAGSSKSSVAFSSGQVRAHNNIWANYAGSLNSVGGQLPLVATQDFNLFFNAPLTGNPIAGGAHSMNADPLFVSAAASDFRLQVNSPAVDSGSDAEAVPGVSTDVAGDPRFVNGHPTRPALVDIGAFEMQIAVPLAIAGGPYSVNEGATLALNASGSSGGAPLTFAWDCTNNGSFDVSGSSPTGLTCTYPDNGSFTLRLLLTNGAGLTSTTTAPVTVSNVAPAVTGPQAQSATATVPAQILLGSFTDPGADAPWSVNVDWGDGSIDLDFTVAAPGSLDAQNHTFAAPGEKIVTVTVDDGDGGVSAVSFAVDVALAPGSFSPAAYLPIVTNP